MSKAIDISGDRFGRLRAVSRAETRLSPVGHQQAMWLCACDCGKTATISTSHLRSGHTKSCGCLSLEMSRSENTTHAMYGTRTYRSWNAMLNRCRNTSAQVYSRYGGRGVSVCDRWASFENFLADMGERPEGKTLDRFPDNKGNYEPGNCRWATSQEQNSNRSNNVIVDFDGRSQCAAEWARDLGITKGAMYRRLKTLPLHAALNPTTTSPKSKG